jgi:hypothetical protein
LNPTYTTGYQSGNGQIIITYDGPFGSAPTCTTDAATILNYGSARLNGTVNPNGVAATAYFNYGLTTSYGNSTTSQDIGIGTSNVNVTANVSGLSQYNIYNFRIVASNSYATIYGDNLTFQPLPGDPLAPPTCTTDGATNTVATRATLNGTVNPNGSNTTAYFQWGTTTSYGNTTSSQNIGSGTSNVNVTADISGLGGPGTLYNFRVVATNSAGTTYGANQIFATLWY